MVIITQNKQAIWQFNDITRLHVTGTGTGIQAVAQNGSGGEIAKYKNRDQCIIALGMLVAAIDANENTFSFPGENELQRNIQHSVSGGGKRHGGS